MFLIDYIKDVTGAVKSLATGMKRTLYYFTHHKEIITEQYPDNRDTLTFPDRFRGRVMGLRILAVYGLPLGLVVAGPLIEWMGFTRTITMYAGLGLICTGAIAIHWRKHLWPSDAPANTALR